MSCDDYYHDYGDGHPIRMVSPIKAALDRGLEELRAINTEKFFAPESGMTDREQFIAVLSTGPLLHADAIVVLCGEDAEPRIAVAAELMRGGGAPLIILTGGVHDGARRLGAEACFAKLIAKGVAFERMEIDPFPTNTREQAVHVAKIAIEREWTRLLLVASPYHAPRAFLTFVHALRERDAHERIRIVNAPASQTKWFEAPTGMTKMRVSLLETEFAKIGEYQLKGDVAMYSTGLAYLEYWESK